jgi:excisionase family DNA binding protein
VEQNIANGTDIRLLSIPEACKRLGIGHWTIYQQINKGNLRTVKVGRRRLVSVRAIDAFITLMER